MVRRRRGWLPRAGSALSGVALLAFAGWFLFQAYRTRRMPDFQWWTNWSNVLAVVATAVAAALPLIVRAVRRPATSAVGDDKLRLAVQDLAARIEGEWSDEAVRREVTRPAPVRARWSSTQHRAAERSVVFDETGTDWLQRPLSGHLDPLNHQLVDAFVGLPHKQLLVLGEPGAGKSVFAILLTIGLIRRHAAQPDRLQVPVLLPINVWDPAEPVAAFVARRLADTYAEVLAPYGDPIELAGRLVQHQQILPVLDGLDELPADAHSRAMKALDDFASAGRPLVVTCRIAEYQQVMRRAAVLSRAAVVELEPVGAPDAITFLSQPVYDERWEPVFAQLRAESQLDTEPAGPLSRALSTPLMVSLARTAYKDRSTDPAQLLSTGPGQSITGRLVDAFLGAIYPSGPGAGTAGQSPQRRWLGCLAYHLDQTGTRDLHWWQIRPDLLAVRPQRARTLTAVTAVAMAALPAGTVGGSTGDSWTAGRAAFAGGVILVVSAAGWLRPIWPRAFPPLVSLTYRRRRQLQQQQLGLRVGYGAGCALLTAVITLDLITALVAGLVCAVLAVALPTWQPTRGPGRATPTQSVRLNSRRMAAAIVQYGPPSGVAFTGVAELTRAAHPWATGIVAATVYAMTAALNAGGWAWLRFRITHIRLALHGWLPWRLRTFLNHAHQRGVLRQAGAVYQLRHAILQDHLANTTQHQHLKSQANAGDGSAAERLAGLLAGQGRVDELRTRADAGDWSATRRLADLLAEQGRVDEAITVLQIRADAGDGSAAERLVDLLAGQGRVDELRARADAGDGSAAERLADLLAEQGRADEAIPILQTQADADDWSVADLLADPLADRLADLLAKQGRVAELRTRADAGDGFAARRLADLLAEQGRCRRRVRRRTAGRPARRAGRRRRGNPDPADPGRRR